MSLALTALTYLEYPGAVLGLVGAFLVASQQASRRRTGFACWIGSNIALVLVFFTSGLWALVAMQTVYLATSGMGWWNNRENRHG